MYHGFLTFDTSYVVADVLVEPVGVDLLLVEVLEVLVEDVVSGLVSFAQVLQDLKIHKKRTVSKKWAQTDVKRLGRRWFSNLIETSFFSVFTDNIN